MFKKEIAFSLFKSDRHADIKRSCIYWFTLQTATAAGLAHETQKNWKSHQGSKMGNRSSFLDPSSVAAQDIIIRKREQGVELEHSDMRCSFSVFTTRPNVLHTNRHN